MSMTKNLGALGAALLLAGCASLPKDRGYAEVSARLAANGSSIPATAPVLDAAAPAEVPVGPIDRAIALRLALTQGSRIHELYARIGFSRADLEEARRIGNPSFGFLRVRPDETDGVEITRSFGIDLGNLLMLPTRRRLAQLDLERTQAEVVDEVMAIAADVDRAWFEAVSARQVARMRALVASAAGHSADLAQRFFEAGNINRLALAEEKAAASAARIAAARAEADALRARLALAKMLALPVDATWVLPEQLPAPSASVPDGAELRRRALTNRADLQALRLEVSVREQALASSRRWRWLGEFHLENEREREADGNRKRGYGFELGLPLFDQGQAAIARAEAGVLDAAARLQAKTREAQNDIDAGVALLHTQRQIVDRYREALLPEREAVVAGYQADVNFMLKGVFELLAVKQEQFDAYQEYLEAIRDYWLARIDLTQAVGGSWPESADTTEVIGVDAILPAPGSAMDHSQHEGMDHSEHEGMDHSQHEGMDRSQHEGMDHSEHEGMGHSQHEGMDHSQHQGMDHSDHRDTNDDGAP